VLRWSAGMPETAVRLHRRLLRAAPAAKTKPSPLATAPEPIEQNLLVEANPQNAGRRLTSRSISASRMSMRRSASRASK